MCGLGAVASGMMPTFLEAKDAMQTIANPRLFTFIGGDSGAWQVIARKTVIGEPLPTVRRLDIVIGNQAYAHAPQLPNAWNDALDVADLLAGQGYDVTLLKDASKRDFEGLMQRVLFDVDFQRAAVVMGVAYYLELILWFHAIRHIDVSVASSVTVPAPAVTMLVAVVFLGEEIRGYQVLAMTVITVSMYGLLLAGRHTGRAPASAERQARRRMTAS